MNIIMFHSTSMAAICSAMHAFYIHGICSLIVSFSTFSKAGTVVSWQECKEVQPATYSIYHGQVNTATSAQSAINTTGHNTHRKIQEKELIVTLTGVWIHADIIMHRLHSTITNHFRYERKLCAWFYEKEAYLCLVHELSSVGFKTFCKRSYMR